MTTTKARGRRPRRQTPTKLSLHPAEISLQPADRRALERAHGYMMDASELLAELLNQIALYRHAWPSHQPAVAAQNLFREARRIADAAYARGVVWGGHRPFDTFLAHGDLKEVLLPLYRRAGGEEAAVTHA